MKNIKKRQEPQSLTSYRKTPGATYGGYSKKDDLRKSLAEEQRKICCYCMSRIEHKRSKMKIEHHKSISHFSALQLKYKNLLGACLGGEGQRKKAQHCDTYKGNKPLSFNPAYLSHNIEKKVYYSGDGKIGSTNQAIDNELNKVLNLNCYNLTQRRKGVIKALESVLKAKKTLNSKQSFLKNEIPRWNSPKGNSLREFCQVAVYFLCDELQKIQKQKARRQKARKPKTRGRRR